MKISYEKVEKFIIFIFLSIICFSLTNTIAFAHPGSLDENGGHFDHSTGEYHYHHGYPAHQHINGECPYDFDNKTRTESSGNSDGTSKSTSTIISDYGEKQKDEDTGNGGLILIVTCLGILLGIILYALIIVQWRSINVKRQIKENAERLEWEKKNNKQRMQEIREEQRRDQFYSYYFKLYAFIPAQDFVAIPSYAYIKNNHPATYGEGIYGRYTVYISKTGNRYHRNPQCTTTRLVAMNYIDVKYDHKPCQKCVRELFPNLRWYDEYARIKKIKLKYHIP